MRPNYLLASFAAFALFHSTANALDECMATLKDPHGSVIVREYGKVVARLKGGEHFLVERMARFLSTQPAKVRENIGVTLSCPGDTEPISKPKLYLKQYFPKTYRILFGKGQ